MDYVVVISLLTVGRLLLSFTSLNNVLRHDHQLSSPLTSFLRLQEGVHLLEHGVDPYSGGIFHHSPLLLSIFSTVLPLTPTSASILWTACDSFSAQLLVGIWRARSKTNNSSRDSLIAVIYMINPYLLLSSLAFSTSTINNTLLIFCIYSACQGWSYRALFTLAFLSHLSLSSALLVVAIIMLLTASPASSLASPKPFTGDKKRILILLSQYFSFLLGLSLISSLSSSGTGWVSKTWGFELMLSELTPNPGLWWYFFTEMFDHFRPFFLMVFSVHLLIYVAPICIKFQHDPLFAVVLLWGVIAAFKPYPTLADPGLFLSLMALFPEVYSHLRHPIVTALLHAHSSLLLPLFHHLWLGQGTGNANFFYASTLLFGLANGAAVLDFAWAGLRVAFGPAQEGVEIFQK